MPGHNMRARQAAGVWQIEDPGDAGAIPVGMSGVLNLTTGTAETRTLADPTFVGQWMTIHCDTDTGTVTITCATAHNATGKSELTLDAVSEVVHLVACTVAGSKVWRSFMAFPEEDTVTVEA